MNRYHPAIPAVANANPGRRHRHPHPGCAGFGSHPRFGRRRYGRPRTSTSSIRWTGPIHINGAKRGGCAGGRAPRHRSGRVRLHPDRSGASGSCAISILDPDIVNWRLTARGAVSEPDARVTVPYEAFPGSIGVQPGEPEVQAWKAREAALAEAGGIALTPQPIGAQPAAVCGPSGSHKDDCLRTIPPRGEWWQHGCSADAGRHEDHVPLLRGRLRPVRRRRALRPGRRRGVRQPPSRSARWSPCAPASSPVPAKAWSRRMSRGNDEIRDIEPTRFHQTIGLPLKNSGEIPIYVTYLESEKIGALENLSEDLTLAAPSRVLIQMIDYIQAEHGLTRRAGVHPGQRRRGSARGAGCGCPELRGDGRSEPRCVRQVPQLRELSHARGAPAGAPFSPRSSRARRCSVGPGAPRTHPVPPVESLPPASSHDRRLARGPGELPESEGDSRRSSRIISRRPALG